MIISRRSQIIETAELIFKEKGYSATGIREIAKEVGIEPASLYNHIGSKEEILKTICFEMAEAFFNSYSESIISLENAVPETKLHSMIRAHISVIYNNWNASSVFLSEWKYLSEPNLSSFKTLRKKYENLFSGVLLEGRDKGDFEYNDIKITLFFIFSAMNSVHELQRSGKKVALEDISKEIGTLIINSIKKIHYVR